VLAGRQPVKTQLRNRATEPTRQSVSKTPRVAVIFSILIFHTAATNRKTRQRLCGALHGFNRMQPFSAD